MKRRRRQSELEEAPEQKYERLNPESICRKRTRKFVYQRATSEPGNVKGRG